ncbi:penicillin-binding protein activator [Streptomyces sp. NPDC050997]|uniref:caspase, EACC1-associated type n=1 Tax=Streptomyces sp. NPDC050997 TaxID=3155519 RepID=UPI00342DBECB
MTELSNPARSRALLIGAHSFAHPDLEPLPAVARNLRRLAALLRDPTVWGLAADHVSVLAEPGRDQALEEVTRLADEAEDTLLVYYAGHGFVHDLSNELYLALPGTNPDRLYSALRYQDIRELLLSPQARARRKVVILDCCWSGLALHGAMSASGLGGMSDIGGTFVLTATSETRTALAPPGETYTAFTGELIDALEHGVPQGPPVLTMMTLYHHLYGSLVAKGRPTPQQRNGNTAGSIALARNRYQPPDPALVEAARTGEGATGQQVTVPSPSERPRPRPKRRMVMVAVSTALVAALGTLPLTLGPLFDGSSDSGSSRGAGTGGDKGTEDGVTVRIGVSVPLTGAYALLGKGIRNSAELAVEQANDKGLVPGVTFEVKALDDKGEAAVGKKNATALVADPSVVGVVGPLNSSVAADTQKILDEALLTRISPANTAPQLTLGDDWLEGKYARPYSTYFRTVANDLAQGPAAARYLYGKEEHRNAFVIDDKKPYGTALAQTFAKAFQAEGGTVVGRAQIDNSQSDITTQVAKARQAGADLVYLGGEYDTAAALSGQFHSTDPGIRVAGGDAISVDTYAELAGDGAEGDICTIGGAVTEKLDSAKPFLAAYDKAGYTNPGDPGPYGGYAYDATWALLRAFKQGVHLTAAHGLPTAARHDVREAVQKVRFDGAMGKVGFDDYGDPITQAVTVYRLHAGKWTQV